MAKYKKGDTVIFNKGTILEYVLEIIDEPAPYLNMYMVKYLSVPGSNLIQVGQIMSCAPDVIDGHPKACLLMGASPTPTSPAPISPTPAAAGLGLVDLIHQWAMRTRAEEAFSEQCQHEWAVYNSGWRQFDFCKKCNAASDD